MASHRSLIPWIALLGFIAALLGCALPDLRPLADATARLHASMVATDANVQLALSEAGARDLAVEVKKELDVRVAAMAAVVNYTEALANIAAAGHNGSGSAENLANTLDGFLGAVSQPTMPANYVAIAKSLYGIVANVRAAKSLAQATRVADPAIQSIATTMTEDMQALENILLTTGKAIQSQLIQENNDISSYRKALEKQRRRLESEMMMTPLDKTRIEQLEETDRLIEMTRDQYEPFEEKLNAIQTRTDLHVHVVRNLQDGLVQWARIHQSLADHLERGLPPNYRLLTATVLEIRQLMNEEDPR